MPRTAATKVYANFTGGMVTEANQLSYPENAAIDIDNLDINENGSIQRRAGLAYEGEITKNIPSTSNPIATTATKTSKWEAVNGNPDRNIAVIQVADRLDFYYIRDDEILSATPAAASISLVDTARASASTEILRQTTPISTVSGGGRLYVVGKYIDPFVLEFTEPATEWDTGTITQTTITLKIRDFGIAGEGETLNGGTHTLDGSERQDYMSGAHFYNLANQGWPSKITASSLVEKLAKVSDAANPDTGASDANSAKYTYDQLSFFPTTKDQYHTYQAGGGDTVTKQIAFSPWLLENDYTGTTNAPRGRIIHEAFYIDRNASGNYGAQAASGDFVDNVVWTEVISSNYRPSAVSFYAGRVWYGGLEGNEYTNNVYYSQVVGDNLNNVGKCYQEADPTAEVINELVATDGGVLGLEEVGKIYKIAPIGPSLVILADNGVWVISGDGEFSSFRADAFSVRKVTDQGTINPDSVVFAKDVIYYWGATSLIALFTGESGSVVAQDISSAAIKTLYQDTTVFIKQNAFSVFDEAANKILWFYEDGLDSSYTSLTGKAFNKVLYFDVSLNAFGKYTLSISTSILPVAAINATTYSLLSIVDDVVDSGATVTDGGEDVTTLTEMYVPSQSSIKVMTVTGNTTSGYSYRFSDFSNVTDFKDWDTSYTSYIEGGFDALEDIIGKGKQAPMIQCHFNRTETGFSESGDELILDNPSGCLLSYAWDWETSPYSNPFQVYKLLMNYIPEDASDPLSYLKTVVSTRSRLRGRGTALGLRFESEEGKDMQLLGYGIVYSARGRP